MEMFPEPIAHLLKLRTKRMNLYYMVGFASSCGPVFDAKPIGVTGERDTKTDGKSRAA